MFDSGLIRDIDEDVDFSSDIQIDTGLEVLVSYNDQPVIEQIRMGRAEKLIGNGLCEAFTNFVVKRIRNF